MQANFAVRCNYCYTVADNGRCECGNVFASQCNYTKLCVEVEVEDINTVVPVFIWYADGGEILFVKEYLPTSSATFVETLDDMII